MRRGRFPCAVRPRFPMEGAAFLPPACMHKEWLEFAAMDLDSAQFLLGMRPVPVEIICYHCEQAAEKLLKAVLVAADVEPPKTHDLIQLCKKCAELDEEYEALADACIELSPYGVQVRYPSNLDLNEDDKLLGSINPRDDHTVHPVGFFGG